MALRWDVNWRLKNIDLSPKQQ